jgi:hypothetical protein
MSFSQFTNLDFKSIRSQIKDYLRANSNFTDFDFEGSNFSILIDILAYNSYITAFNTNMAVNEAFIDSATLRENVVSLAKNIGYVPRSKRAARAKISFFVDTSGLNSRTVTIRPGVVALGALEGGSYIFSITKPITTNVDSTGIAYFNNVDIFEGIFLTKTYQYNNSQPNQKFIIPNPNVDTSTIRVRVFSTTNEEYNAYTNIFDVDKDSKLFLLQEIEDEKYQIIFGDGIFGKKPLDGSSINISYVVTNGRFGNGASGFTFSGILVDNNENTITKGISLLTTVQPAENGDDIESIDSIKYLAPRVYSSQYRAVTANDYKGLIPYIYPNVESVIAYGGEETSPPEYGKVFISIKPRNGSFISQITKDDIKRKLKQYSIAGIKPEIIDLKYLFIELDINVYYNSSLISSIDDLKSQVMNTLLKYSNTSEVNNFAGRFKYSKIIGLIDETNNAITSNITKVKMRRDLQPILNKLASYEICFGNEFHIRKTNFTDNRGYNIKSSGFTISGVENLIYMSDVPINDDIGTIFFFRFEQNTPFIVSKNAGRVQYKKGEILLNPVVITSTEKPNGIEIQAVPESNDIVALRDLYLSLSIENTLVNIIEDSISSGEELSGSNYTVTSSYTNGKFTR